MYGIAIKVLNGTGYTFVGDFNGKILYSMDEGSSWTSLPSVPFTLYSVAIGSNGRLFFGTSSVTVGTVPYTSWTRVSVSGTSVGTVNGVATLDGGVAIAVTSLGRGFFTTNGGTSWTNSGKFFYLAGVQSTTAGGANTALY